MTKCDLEELLSPELNTALQRAEERMAMQAQLSRFGVPLPKPRLRVMIAEWLFRLIPDEYGFELLMWLTRHPKLLARLSR